MLTKEQIKEQIKTTKTQLKAQKILLDQVEQAEATPFVETKLMRGYFHTVRAISKPFAWLNKRAERALENPTLYRREMVLEKAEKVLQMAENMPGDSKYKKNMVRNLHDMIMIMELDQEKTKAYRPDGWGSCLDGLKGQLDRLRPPKDMKRAQEIQEELAGMVDNIQQTLATERKPEDNGEIAEPPQPVAEDKGTHVEIKGDPEPQPA